jgi:hypothetical protein
LPAPTEYKFLDHELSAIPRSPLPDDLYGKGVVKLLKQASGGTAAYVGKGLFRLTTERLTKLAAGTGRWAAAVSQTVAPLTEAALTSVAAGGGDEELSEVIPIFYEAPKSRLSENVAQRLEGVALG